MRRDRQVTALALVAGCMLVFSACSSDSTDAEPEQPATVESVQIGGATETAVKLTAQAVRRLDIQTAPVGQSPEGKTLIPPAALLYNPDGTAYTYTNPEPLVFVRRPITLESVSATSAVITAGPPVGMLLVTVGAPELAGVELSGFEE